MVESGGLRFEEVCGLMIEDWGLRVEGWGLRFEIGWRDEGWGLRVQGSGWRVEGWGDVGWGLRVWVVCCGLRVQGSGFRVEGEKGMTCVVLTFNVEGWTLRVVGEVFRVELRVEWWGMKGWGLNVEGLGWGLSVWEYSKRRERTTYLETKFIWISCV